MAVGTRCANHVTPLYPQKLALTSPTGGGRSVGIVRSRTKATEFSFSFLFDLVPPERLSTIIAATGVDLRVVVFVKEFLLGRSQRIR